MSQWHHESYSSKTLDASGGGVDIMNQENDSTLDWDNTASIWTAPLHSLPPPPINPLVLGLSSSIEGQVTTVPAVNFPPVYPYIPPPSIALLEQMETERKTESSDQTLPTASSARELDVDPPTSTPPQLDAFISELSGHNNSPWSAKSRISTDNASSSPISTKGEDIKYEENKDQESTVAAEHEDTSCSTTYVRGVIGAGINDHERYQHLIHGQIWHGNGDKPGRRWRRHQWVLERSLVTTATEGDQAAQPSRVKD
jgi:hypothetical protein